MPPSRAELERFFFLDDADEALIAKRRSDHSKLGFSLQLVTVRFLGTFLTDPPDVSTVVLDYVWACWVGEVPGTGLYGQDGGCACVPAVHDGAVAASEGGYDRSGVGG